MDPSGIFNGLSFIYPGCLEKRYDLVVYFYKQNTIYILSFFYKYLTDFYFLSRSEWHYIVELHIFEIVKTKIRFYYLIIKNVKSYFVLIFTHIYTKYVNIYLNGEASKFFKKMGVSVKCIRDLWDMFEFNFG